MLCRLGALKVVVSQIGETSTIINEVRILQRLASIPAKHNGQRHLRKFTDYFFHDGPNGRYQCLVFDVDGVSVPTLVTRCGDTRLPGRLAWQLSQQITLALDCLHSNGIAHGDLYPGNILISQREGQSSDPGSLNQLGPPVLAEIYARPGRQITKSLPRYIVEPATFPVPAMAGQAQVHASLIDFEQAFLRTDQSLAKVRTPLIFRAPETLLDSTWDLRIDIWSLACTIFELVTGQLPFDNFMPTKPPLVLEWIAMFGDVPEKWRMQAKEVVGDCQNDIDGGSLTSWLCEVDFGSGRKPEFSKEDIERLADLLARMMCYLPSERLSAQDILKHEWFVKNPLAGKKEE
ncbi:CMGC protein kinase [Capronia epimyces CBS 606.96]|uniref:CMGC protein kinase n=1 Tax=Capronia epimyces CBS 606.96 TaxID=1182542 RepID=W9YT78_9EURO|nr:CMGC protein kinase [Capronia epimyces CBS 606.96]EXJ92456.1 CMGC protein kinase [Capronia epimyces CBS 606.96]